MALSFIPPPVNPLLLNNPFNLPLDSAGNTVSSMAYAIDEPYDNTLFPPDSVTVDGEVYQTVETRSDGNCLLASVYHAASLAGVPGGEHHPSRPLCHALRRSLAEGIESGSLASGASRTAADDAFLLETLKKVDRKEGVMDEQLDRDAATMFSLVLNIRIWIYGWEHDVGAFVASEASHEQVGSDEVLVRVLYNGINHYVALETDSSADSSVGDLGALQPPQSTPRHPIASSATPPPPPAPYLGPRRKVHYYDLRAFFDPGWQILIDPRMVESEWSRIFRATNNQAVLRARFHRTYHPMVLGPLGWILLNRQLGDRGLKDRFDSYGKDVSAVRGALGGRMMPDDGSRSLAQKLELHQRTSFPASYPGFRLDLTGFEDIDEYMDFAGVVDDMRTLVDTIEKEMGDYHVYRSKGSTQALLNSLGPDKNFVTPLCSSRGALAGLNLSELASFDPNTMRRDSKRDYRDESPSNDPVEDNRVDALRGKAHGRATGSLTPAGVSSPLPVALCDAMSVIRWTRQAAKAKKSAGRTAAATELISDIRDHQEHERNTEAPMRGARTARPDHGAKVAGRSLVLQIQPSSSMKKDLPKSGKRKSGIGGQDGEEQTKAGRKKKKRENGTDEGDGGEQKPKKDLPKKQ